MRTVCRIVAVLTVGALTLTACEAPWTERTRVSERLSAAKGGSVSLGKARIDVAPRCLRADADVSIERHDDGPTGERRFEFGTGGVSFCGHGVTIRMPLDGADDELVAAAFATGGGRWRGQPASYDAVEGVVIARVDHLSSWSPIDLVEELRELVTRRVTRALSLRTAPPTCGGRKQAPRVHLGGSALRATDPPVYACSYRASDRRLWIEIANNRSYGVRVNVPGDVRVMRRPRRGTVAEHALRTFRTTRGSVYVPSGATVTIRASTRGRRLALAVRPDVPASVISLVADVVTPMLGAAGNAAAAGVALADCVRGRGESFSSGVPKAIVRIVIDCIAAVASAIDRQGNGKLDVPTVTKRVVRFGARTVRRAVLALDAAPVVDLVADRLRFGGRSDVVIRRPPKPKPRPKPLPVLPNPGGTIVVPEHVFTDACCNCGCHHH